MRRVVLKGIILLQTKQYLIIPEGHKLFISKPSNIAQMSSVSEGSLEVCVFLKDFLNVKLYFKEIFSNSKQFLSVHHLDHWYITDL